MDNLPNWLIPLWILCAPLLVVILSQFYQSKTSTAYSEVAEAQRANPNTGPVAACDRA